jgi:hypothetical protein
LNLTAYGKCSDGEFAILWIEFPNTIAADSGEKVLLAIH